MSEALHKVPSGWGPQHPRVTAIEPHHRCAPPSWRMKIRAVKNANKHRPRLRRLETQ